MIRAARLLAVTIWFVPFCSAAGGEPAQPVATFAAVPVQTLRSSPQAPGSLHRTARRVQNNSATARPVLLWTTRSASALPDGNVDFCAGPDE